MSKPLIDYSRDLGDFLRPPTGRCLGAVFLSYDFDEAFFESVLASLLPIHADPDTDPDRFVDEGRRRLRETPVAVLVDGHRARGGHRLPFDLLKASPNVAFHLKLALTLFADHARLMMGSANLTEGGYGGNAELVSQLVLDYNKDSAMIAAVRQLIVDAGVSGEAWDRIDAQLQLLQGPARANQATALLHSQGGKSVFDQLIQRLPKTAKIDGVSLLLGIQPEDDPVAETQILDALIDRVAKASKKLPPFEIGLPWEGNALAPATDAPEVSLEAVLGQLCARLVSTDNSTHRSLDYVVPLRSEGQDIVCQGQHGAFKMSKRKLRDELSEKRLWPVPEIVATGPVAPLERLIERAPARFFAFPELRLDEGQVYRRAMHAKLIAVRTTEGKQQRTHLLIGVPSFERFADDANRVVEVAIHEVRPGHLGLNTLAPELVEAPVEQLYLQNRPLPAPQAQRASPLESAVFDARTRTLSLVFAPGRRTAAVVYQNGEEELVLIDGEPRVHESFTDFSLDRHSAELAVSVEDDRWLVPIAFRNVAELVCDEPRFDLGPSDGRFWAFVDLLCGREDASGRGEAGDRTQETSDLPDERMAPSRVFRAIATLASDLTHAGASLGAFSVAMHGPTGLVRFAECWALQSQTEDGLDRSEAWLYGQELARALRGLRFGKDASGRHRALAIASFLTTLDARIAKLAARASYVKTIDRFYRKSP